MEWFIWLLIGYYVLNLVLLPSQTGKTRLVTSGEAGFQAIVWIGFIVGLLVMVL